MTSVRMARAALWVTIVVTLADIGVFVAARAGPEGGSGPFALAGTGLGVLGFIIVARARNAVGWCFMVAGLSLGLSSFAESYVQLSLLGGARLPATPLAAWMNGLAQPAGAGVLPLVFLLFPTGRAPSPRWRHVQRLWAAAFAVLLTATALRPGTIYATPDEQGGLEVANPLGVSALEAVLEPLVQAAFAALALVAGAALVSLVVRFRRSRGELRQQMKWLVYVAALAGVLLLAVIAIELIRSGSESRALETVSGVVFGLFAALFGLGVPAAVAIAVLRYRLYDIDLVINRTLVYATLAIFITAAYVGVVVGVGSLLGRAGEPDLGLSVVATALVAIGFHPARAGVQRVMNRLLYGDRDDPYAAVSRLGRSLEASIPAGEVLARITETVRQALKVPYVAIELGADGAEPATAAGQPVADPLALPLVYRGETVGRLLVAPRRGTEGFTPPDQRLLEDLARQAGVAAHTVRLTRDLQRSRERLVVAQEDERRRLRRNLHDGLGPTLAGMALELETARGLVRDDGDAADGLLVRLQGQIQDAIADIRRIVYDLRPPSLDQLGLVGALREDGGRLAGAGLALTFEAPDELPPLPAATEVAAYRIALEGISNAVRHAEASTCRVRLHLDGELEVEVRDDGRGIPAGGREGVGLTSMRERAAELGGTFTIERPDGGGTRILARLPVEIP